MVPLVSIVIPFYNRFLMIEEALEMVSCQTFQHYEVILIDDGSEDAFPIERIKAQFDFPIKYNKLSENSGPGAARRKGREISEGRYIAYLDSDDWWSDNFIEECVNIIETDKSLGMVYTNTIKVING